MNKKIIAIAIASAMAAPAAMADLKIGGQLGAALVQGSKAHTSATAANFGAAAEDTTKASRTMQDSGLSKVEFTFSDGNAIGKVAMDTRAIFGGGSPTGRDFWLGYKFGSAGTFSAGRMGAALAGIEGDKYNATFLEMRRTAAVSSTDNATTDSYSGSPVLQWAMKAGGASIKIQYDATDNAHDTTSSKQEGYYGISVKGKAGAVGYFAGVNNGSGGDVDGNSEQNVKAGVSMKFGAAKVTAMMMQADHTGATETESSTTIFADIGVGSGTSVGVGYGMKNAGANKKDTWMRLAVTKNLSKKSAIFAGYVAEHDDDNATTKDTNAMGVGMKVKF